MLFPLTVPVKVTLAPVIVSPLLVESMTIVWPVPLIVTAPRLIVPPRVNRVDAPLVNVVVPKFMLAPEAIVWTVPKIATVPAVTPPAKVKPLAIVTVPLLLNVAAGVIIPPLFNTTE